MRKYEWAALADLDEDDLDFPELFGLYRRRSLYSLGQLARLTGIPKRTLGNWEQGIARPRDWKRVTQLAAALRLGVVRANRFLKAARLPLLQELAVRYRDDESQLLLAPWTGELEPNDVGLPESRENSEVTAEERLLRDYLMGAARAFSQLPAYYPRHLTVTFAWIRQEVRLAPLRYGSDDFEDQANDAAPYWSECRHTLQRVMLLGKPGAGKTWLLKSEALRQIEDSLDGKRGGTLLLPLYLRLSELAALLTLQSGLDETLAAVAQSAARNVPDLAEERLSAAILRVLREEPARVTLLLDGLDEVPARQNLRAVARHLIHLIAKGTGLRFWVTTRLLGYAYAPLAPVLGPDVIERTLLPLRPREIGRAVRVWFYGREERFQQVQYAMRRLPVLIHLASNPLLLSMVCVLADVDPDALAGSRSLLLTRAVRLLLEGTWRNFELRLPEERVRRKMQLLETMAWCFATHRGQWAEEVSGDVLEEAIAPLRLTTLLTDTWRPEWDVVYEGPLWELSDHDGVLVKGYVPVNGLISEVPYRFVHPNLQELLVARYLVRRFREDGFDAPEIVDLLAGRLRGHAWHRVLLLLNERLITESDPGLEALARRLSDYLLADPPDPTGVLTMAAGEIVFFRGGEFYDTHVTDRVRRRLLDAMRNSTVPVFPRVHAGRLLEALGDSRRAIMEVDALEFVEIPGGPFLMGSDLVLDPDAAVDELPQRLLDLPSFFITRYPISNAQYRQFLDAPDGFDNADNWCEAMAAGYWANGEVLREVRVHKPNGEWAYEIRPLRAPLQSGWPATLPNHPATGLNWYEARAFVRWLEARDRAAGRLDPDEYLDLPSEPELEKTMRGIDGRIYPWGNRFDRNRLNWHGLLFMASSPIGAFPHGASPFGVEDVVGGLWEWTRTLYAPYDGDYGAEVTVTTPATAEVVQRGGSYYDPVRMCRCAARAAAVLYGQTSSQFRVVRRRR